MQNIWYGITLISPVIFNVLMPSNEYSSIDVNEDGIDISVNDEQLEKTLFPIFVTDWGIIIW